MESADELAADELLVIQYLDARGPDGMARKYRVMFIDGQLYPLHLAVSSHWKVHYFSADMAENAAFRQEEERFLNDMPAVLGETGMRALQDVCTALGLEYAGIDFALSADGSILLFEANATMVVFPPNPLRFGIIDEERSMPCSPRRRTCCYNVRGGTNDGPHGANSPRACKSTGGPGDRSAGARGCQNE
jgi:hypothetical protein